MITRLGQLGKRLDAVLENHSDMIIHTGAFVGGEKSFKDPSRYLKNVEDTFRYLEEARKEEKKFVFTSTYDTSHNPYTESKRAGERMIKLWHEIYQVNYLIFIIPSIIGKGVVDNFLQLDSASYSENKELEFLTLDEVAETIKQNIHEENRTIVLKGRKITVKLLYDLLRYARKSIQPAT